MPIKTKKPVIRTPAVFDTIDAFDIRFRKIKNKWMGTIRYFLITDTGERQEKNYQEELDISDNEIKQLEKLINKIVDGTIS